MILRPFLIFINASFIFWTLLRDVECAVKSKMKTSCLNTSLTPASCELMDIGEVQGNITKSIWNKLDPFLSDEAKNFAKLVNYHMETDSPALKTLLFHASIRALMFVSNIEDTPNLCSITCFMNDSIFENTKEDYKETIESFYKYAEQQQAYCSLLTYSTLCHVGCEAVAAPIIPEKCYKNGLAFDLDRVLKLQGKYVPCELHGGLKSLYKSNDRVNSVISVVFSSMLFEMVYKLHSMQPLHLLLDFLYIILQDKWKKECCVPRQKRLNEICSAFNVSFNKYAKKIVREKYGDYGI